MLQVITKAKLDPAHFCFWLQGFCEIHGSPPNEKQWEMIKQHLEMCFDHAKDVPDNVTTFPDSNGLVGSTHKNMHPLDGVLIC